MKTFVVKIGGSYWGSVNNGAGKKCEELAEKLCELSQIYNLVVVPSAFKDRTDDLIKEAGSVYGSPLVQCPGVDQIISRGEVEAAAQLCANLLMNGQRTKVVYPDFSDFPIVADSRGNVDLPKSYNNLDNLFRECKEDGEILIVPGFVARNCSGVVTLGRNGSDYSLVIVGEGVDADKIVKAGAAPGVSDGNGGYLQKITVGELLSQKNSNGKCYRKYDCVFHPEGLKILSQGRKIHVTNNIDQYLTGNVQHGTSISA